MRPHASFSETIEVIFYLLTQEEVLFASSHWWRQFKSVFARPDQWAGDPARSDPKKRGLGQLFFSFDPTRPSI